MVIAPGEGSVGGQVDVVASDVGDQAAPLAVTPGQPVQLVQALQAAQRGLGELVRAGQGQGVAQVGLLGSHCGQHVGCPSLLLDFAEVVLANCGVSVGVRPFRRLGCVVGGSAVVVAEERGEEPGQGGVDGVVTAAVAGELPQLDRPVEQRDQPVAVDAAQRGHQVGLGALGVTHELQHGDVDRVAEQVQHGELGAFGFGEGLVEPVGQ